ncbi:MAG: beta-propeller domain-containing protein, partial [Solirubrobacteraceae bacterium]|nr:beta-propeller domain-containing protein [Solirubrobacteraceae bacterium]
MVGVLLVLWPITTQAFADPADRLIVARTCDEVVSAWRNGSLKYVEQPSASNLRDPKLEMDPLNPPPTPTPRPNPNPAMGTGYDDADEVVPEDEDSFDSSDTNVQDQSVAEPDYVKHDERHLFVVGGHELRVLTATGRSPEL